MINIKLSRPSFSTDRNKHIEELILILILVFSIIGIGITDFSPENAHGYWFVMTALLAAAGIGIGWLNKSSLPEQSLKKVLIIQIIHWAATAVSILGVYLLFNTGRLNFENLGLVLLLILGLSTFLDGCRISWRFSLVGALMTLTAIIAAYVEEFLWIIIIIAIVLIIFSVLWERHKNSLTVNKIK